MDKKLSGRQRKYLRGKAHALANDVQIGRNGLTDGVVTAIDTALEQYELIKVKFDDFKKEKKELSATIEEKTSSEMVGMVGNVAIFFRQQDDKERRELELP